MEVRKYPIYYVPELGDWFRYSMWLEDSSQAGLDIVVMFSGPQCDEIVVPLYGRSFAVLRIALLVERKVLPTGFHQLFHRDRGLSAYAGGPQKS